MDKLGVFLCTGCGIGDAVDVDEVIEAADEQGCAATLTHECLCAPEGLEAITASVSENELNGILVAACSERAKTEEFASLTKDGLVMFIDANRGGSVPFGQLIPSTSEQLTQQEAEALGWFPDPIEP